jgi:hypothetical protein
MGTDREDALKWRALMDCDRIRIMGSTYDMNHIGVEFWVNHRSKHPSQDFPQGECRQTLDHFARRQLYIPPSRIMALKNATGVNYPTAAEAMAEAVGDYGKALETLNGRS